MVPKIVLLVSDLRGSRRFYQGLGFRVVERREDAATMALGQDVVVLQMDTAAIAGPQYFTPEIERFPRGTGVELAFATPDVDALYEQARSLDVDLVGTLEPADDGTRQFRVSDPDGYLLRFTTAAETERRRVTRTAGT